MLVQLFVEHVKQSLPRNQSLFLYLEQVDIVQAGKHLSSCSMIDYPQTELLELGSKFWIWEYFAQAFEPVRSDGILDLIKFSNKMCH